MLTRFVCLANSYKKGGRCLAGVALDNNNNPAIESGHPKWIRPVCDTPHGEIPHKSVLYLSILDIIEIDVTGCPEQKRYQSENVLFRENSINVIGRFDSGKLNLLCDNRNLIFESRGKAVSEETIGKLAYSLKLIKVHQFEVTEKPHNDKPNKQQIRLLFSYHENQYDFPVTDPVFLYQYQSNPDFMKQFNKAFLTVSLGIAWQNWHYKLVAGVILMNDSVIQKNAENN